MKFKKHFCPKCNKILILKEKNKIINSNSKEAIDYDFFNGDNFMLGNVKFVWHVFYCSDCNIEFTIKEIKKYELNFKK